MNHKFLNVCAVAALLLLGWQSCSFHRAVSRPAEPAKPGVFSAESPESGIGIAASAKHVLGWGLIVVVGLGGAIVVGWYLMGDSVSAALQGREQGSSVAEPEDA